MALGKIKADTLEHSTAGSLDTSYVVNGSAKLWIQATSAASVSTQGSFNVSSVTDVAAGALNPNATNTFSNDDYAVGCVSNHYHVTITSMATNGFRYTNHNSSHAAADAPNQCATVHGDLA